MAPILVVGASTTGLTAACELARRGVQVRVVEKSPTPDARCRACLVRLRTLEILDDLGAAHEVVARAQPARGASIYEGDQRLTAVRPTIADAAFASSVCIEQGKTEQALERVLNRLGVRVERATELVDLADGDRGAAVRATLSRDGVAERVDAAWVVGCDGAHSRVREIRGIAFPGEQDPLAYVVADVRVNTPAPRDEVAIYLGTGSGTTMMMAFPLPDGRTLVFGGDRQADADAIRGLRPSRERVQELLVQHIGPRAQLTDPRWLSYFRVDYRVAAAYRDGRVLLAGDATHVFSPAGGQGMNMGIQDAYNLGWKLALVASGRAPDTLLDSYERERRPVAQAAVESTRLMTENLKLVAQLPPLLRGPVLRATTGGEPHGQEQAARRAEQLDVDYGPTSLGATEDGAFAAGGPRPGQQAPATVPVTRDGVAARLSDVLRGTRFTLLLFPLPNASSRQRLNELRALVADDLADSYLVEAPRGGAPAGFEGRAAVLGDPTGAVRRAYGVEGEALYLVRPDGHVAYRGQPATAAGLRQTMDGLLRQPARV